MSKHNTHTHTHTHEHDLCIMFTISSSSEEVEFQGKDLRSALINRINNLDDQELVEAIDHVEIHENPHA